MSAIVSQLPYGGKCTMSTLREFGAPRDCLPATVLKDPGGGVVAILYPEIGVVGPDDRAAAVDRAACAALRELNTGSDDTAVRTGVGIAEAFQGATVIVTNPPRSIGVVERIAFMVVGGIFAIAAPDVWARIVEVLS